MDGEEAGRIGAAPDEAGDLRFIDPEPRIHTTAQLKACRIGRYAAVGERVVLREVALGDFSYFERNAEAIYADIGKFCSIASNTRINALAHPIERATTHKLTYRPNEYFRYRGVDAGYREKRRQARVRIGHDVWIGHGAVVMPGITIGSGAVVGANAVVTHDVEAYAIVAGVPARPLRMRFGAETIARLQALEWWHWPVSKLFDAVPDMQKMEIDAFVEKWSD